MKRFLVLPLLAVAVALAPPAFGQPGDDFGILKTTPAAAPTAAPRPAAGLPAGVEPARPTAAAAPNPYPLSPDAGAWLICAAAYSGADGADLARQVCEHLRAGRYNAFVFNRGDEERRQQDEEWEQQKKANPGVQLRRKFVRIADHYAVLIAGWPDFKTASEVLPVIKKLPLPELTLASGANPYEVVSFRDVDPETKQVVTKSAKVNPFQSAMVTRNPLAPKEVVNKPKFDPLWTKLNKDEEYSLLECKGRYSLIVKEYQGARVIQSARGGTGGFLSAIGLGGSRQGELLDASAAQAHELAKFLRKTAGVKAFVLHMRSSSVVTVGEFPSADDPELQRTQRHLTSLHFGDARNGGNDPIGLMANPIPVEVPRP